MVNQNFIGHCFCCDSAHPWFIFIILSVIQVLISPGQNPTGTTYSSVIKTLYLVVKQQASTPECAIIRQQQVQHAKVGRCLGVCSKPVWSSDCLCFSLHLTSCYASRWISPMATILLIRLMAKPWKISCNKPKLTFQWARLKSTITKDDIFSAEQKHLVWKTLTTECFFWNVT